MSLIAIPCRKLSYSLESERKAQGVLSSYVEALTSMGASVVLLPIQKPEIAKVFHQNCDGLLLTGGEDVSVQYYGCNISSNNSNYDRERDEFELNLIKTAVSYNIPILGICRGLQLLNIAFGGTVAQIHTVVTQPVRHRTDWVHGEIYTHKITVTGDTIFARICGNDDEFQVNGSHSLCVNSLAKEFRVSARAPDGIIEAIEMEDGAPCLAVQWHPESLLLKGDINALSLFSWFIKICDSHMSR